MAVRAFHSLVMCCWLSRAAGLGTNRSDSASTDSVTGTVMSNGILRWLPQNRLFVEDRTPQGRLIPGLAKNSRCCGIVNHDDTRIVNGTATAPNEFPWMAALVDASGEFRNGSPYCGGTLISDRYVVTAAHCVAWWPSPQWGQVILGKHETLQNSDKELRLDVEKVIVHPKFDQTTNLNNDISLLKLKTPLQLPIGDNFISPICLPSRIVFDNDAAEIAGWGLLKAGGNQTSPIDRPRSLHSLKMRTVNNAVCRFLNRIGLMVNFAVQPNMVCAVATTKGTGPCNGDSGSPLMIAARYRKSRRALLGITSWIVLPCGAPNPDVFVRIPWFLDWIIANTRDAKYC